MSDNSLSVIVPCYHANPLQYAMTQKCITALKNTPCKIILVENLYNWCAGQSDIYVHYKEGRSYAKNVNTGLKLADTEYVAVINNDAYVPNGWFKAILECFDKPDCGVACIDSTQYNRKAEDVITEDFFGSLWVAKKSLIDKIGLLDEQFVHAFDDADYWVRVYQAGYKIYMNRRVQVDHKGGATIYSLGGHNEAFTEMRKLFNEKYKDCDLPICHKLR